MLGDAADLEYPYNDGRVTVKGLDLSGDILGKVSFGDMTFLELMDRLPSSRESIVFNAILVCLVEHGVTPSSLAARLTYLGAPESLQAAVAAGLLGLGSVFVGTIEGSAKLLQVSLKGAPAHSNLAAVARKRVEEHFSQGATIPGLGHPLHKPVDPRTSMLFQIASDNGFSGRYIELMILIQGEAERRYQRALPINATGAIGAIASELGIPWRICRGLGVIARAAGLVGHLLEEMKRPLAREVWLRVEEEATEHIRRHECP